MSDATDLVLMSNTCDILVKHYMINLVPEFGELHCIRGEVILFLEPLTSTTLSKPFELILDSRHIIVRKVEEISCSKKWDPSPQSFGQWSSEARADLSFSVEDWCIKIIKNTVFNADKFPRVIAIKYQTTSKGESILWRTDEGGHLCFFTCGSQINNRSLLPCQDRPGADATWELQVKIPKNYYVSCTGDDGPVCLENGKSQAIYYSTQIVLPISTFAIAAGIWEERSLMNLSPTDSEEAKYISCHHSPYPCHWSSNKITFPISIVAPRTEIDRVMDVFMYSIHYITVSSEILGRLPIKRLQFVLMPRCFSSLAFTSPHLVFISPNLSINDSSTFNTISREISHFWFGISIGPKNWEEDWISEGFSAFLEDIIYSKTASGLATSNSLMSDINLRKAIGCLNYISDEDARRMILDKNVLDDLTGLRSQIKYKLLAEEMANTPEDLQIVGMPDGNNVNQVLNGLNVEKKFTQVSYLKGYFLLSFISNIVGEKSFLAFLRMFVIKYHSCLVSSDDILDEIYQAFPSLSQKVAKYSLKGDWLLSSGLNESIKKFSVPRKENRLLEDVELHHQFWMSSEKREIPRHLPDFVFSDQICYLLDGLLEMPELRNLQQIHSFYQIEIRSAHVKHRWCEMIIKFGAPNHLDVGSFLLNYQSMGVYLYGEIMISNNRPLRKLARNIFGFLHSEMDEPTKKIVAEMLDVTFPERPEGPTAKLF